MDRGRLAGILGVVFLLSLSSPSRLMANPQQDGAVTATSVDDPSGYRDVVRRYCAGCHNDRLRTGNLSLASVSVANVGEHADVWERVLDKLQTQSMPPPGRPRPDSDTYDRFAGWLEVALDEASSANPNPGRPTAHRLNRLEYVNAIRDLLDLNIDGEGLLPADDIAFGFDNNADILTVAPGMLERYMQTARTISRLALGDPAIQADTVRYAVSSLLTQDERMGEEFPFGARGGIAIQHHFPRDGEYFIRLRLRGNGGRNEPQEIDVRLDDERVALLRVGRWPTAEDKNAVPAGALDLRTNRSSDDSLEVRLPIRAGEHRLSVSFQKRTSVTEGVAPSRLPIWTFSTGRGFVERMALDSVEIDGPYATNAFVDGNSDEVGELASRRRIFSCYPEFSEEEESCVDEILRRLLRRAFRRPATDLDVAVALGFYREGRAGRTFDAGIQRGLESIIVDPEFLFRLERDPVDVLPATAYRLSDLELASRLSFFIWSSIPDDELFSVAVAGRLHEPVVLEEQVRRMLIDERSQVLVRSFGAQWLHLRRMRTVTPDVNAFPAFDDNLRTDLVRETELFLENELRNDESVVNLLTADYTFVNERLARHYGLSGVYGPRFRRVEWDDARRRGLLGHGSILTVTSLATRTSPVVRGKWILENILGTPPPPPPPDVPDLPEPVRGASSRSVRERLEEHRANPVCSNCHARMDPLGFALEHFDAVGQWREVTDGNVPIDPSGVLPNGTAFGGLPELRDVLVGRKKAFVTTVSEKLLTYALGRGLEYFDQPAVRRIVREAEADEYRWSALVLGVTRSMPFRMRRAEP